MRHFLLYSFLSACFVTIVGLVPDSISGPIAFTQALASEVEHGEACDQSPGQPFSAPHAAKLSAQTQKQSVNQEAALKKFSLWGGVGASRASLSQDNFTSTTNIVLNLNIRAEYNIAHAWLTLIQMEGSVLPIQKSGSSLSVKDFDAEALTAYDLIPARKGVGFRLYGGLNYSTSYAGDRYFGYYNAWGPEIMPGLILGKTYSEHVEIGARCIAILNDSETIKNLRLGGVLKYFPKKTLGHQLEYYLSYTHTEMFFPSNQSTFRANQLGLGIVLEI